MSKLFIYHYWLSCTVLPDRSKTDGHLIDRISEKDRSFRPILARLSESPFIDSWEYFWRIISHIRFYFKTIKIWYHYYILDSKTKKYLCSTYVLTNTKCIYISQVNAVVCKIIYTDYICILYHILKEHHVLLKHISY